MGEVLEFTQVRESGQTDVEYRTKRLETKLLLVSGSIAERDAVRELLIASYVERPTLFLSPTGTGKSEAAKLLHDLRGRPGKLVPVELATAPDLHSAQLRGYQRGAFTGAHVSHDGYFKQANGGTLFLDDVDRLDLSAQGELLQTIESGKFCPLGSEKNEESRFDLIAATNRNLEDMIRDRKFREDLYYRLKGATIRLPTLQERGTKAIEAFVLYFLKRANETYKHLNGKVEFTKAAMETLLNYSFPGNIRELANHVEYMAVACKTENSSLITDRHFPKDIRDHGTPNGTFSSSHQRGGFSPKVVYSQLQQYLENAAYRELFTEYMQEIPPLSLQEFTQALNIYSEKKLQIKNKERRGRLLGTNHRKLYNHPMKNLDEPTRSFLETLVDEFHVPWRALRPLYIASVMQQSPDKAQQVLGKPLKELRKSLTIYERVRKTHTENYSLPTPTSLCSQP